MTTRHKPTKLFLHSAEDGVWSDLLFRRKHDKHHNKVWVVSAIFATASEAAGFMRDVDADSGATENHKDCGDEEIETPCVRCRSTESRHFGRHHSGIEIRQCAGCNHLFAVGVSW